jgi:hypothetical protein
LAELARVQPGMPSFTDAATTAEQYLASLKLTQPSEQAQSTHVGTIKRWLVLGPISWPLNKGPAFDFEQVAGENRIRPKAGETTAWQKTTLTWQEISQEDYVIDFINVLGRMTQRSVVYAVCYLRAETAQSGLRLHVGSDSRAQVYLNGEMIYENRAARPFDPDHDTVNDVTLNAGINALLLKVVVEADTRRWRDSVRFTDAAGKPLTGITVKMDPD